MKNIKLHKHFLLIIGVDTLLIIIAWYCAFLLRFNFLIPEKTVFILGRSLAIVALIKVIIFYYMDLYKGMWRYTSIDDLFNIIKASSIGTLLLFFLVVFTHGLEGFARSIFIIDWFLTIIFISTYRISVRLLFWFVSEAEADLNLSKSNFKLRRRNKKAAKRILIIGAGDCGEKILREIKDNDRLRYRVVGFVDDDSTKLKRKIHDVPGCR
jgi:FlaA1/EpsC-like NDP-sugar epimerase